MEVFLVDLGRDLFLLSFGGMLILSRDQFRQLVEERTQQMKVEMAPFPQVTTHWVKPFDDPEAEFTPLYLILV